MTPSVELEAIHFNEQLVERLLALVIAAAKTGAAMTPDGVDFVDEHDAGRIFLRLLEHVAHARSADADEHLDEIGARDGEERHIGFARNGAGQQRLAGSRRADQQNALGDAAAQPLKFLRIPQELHDLFEFFLGLVDAGYVLERHPAGTFGQKLGAALSEAHRLAAARLHLAHDVEPNCNEQQHRKPVDEHAQKRRHAVVIGLHAYIDVVLLHPRVKAGIVGGRVGGERLAVGELAFYLIALDRDLLDRALNHLLVEFREGNGRRFRLVRRALEHVEKGNEQKRDDDPKSEIAEIVHGRPFLGPIRRHMADLPD